ncbi:MAG: HlyC/CorC family transporter [Flavobacteriales bacterium]|nr:HlyC/CorC family transporter [Flavobacteriales bacterium]
MELWVITLSLVLSAFFSGMEIAFVSSNKVYLGIEKLQENLVSKILTFITKKPSQFIATMLVGNNIALVIYGFYMGEFLIHWMTNLPYILNEWGILITQTILSTIIILITAEFFPKVIFQIYANQCLKWFSIPALLFYVLLYLPSKFAMLLSDGFLRLFFKTKGDESQEFFSKVELGHYITEQMNSVDEKTEVDSEIEIFQNALEFTDTKAREIMVPRTEMAAIEIHDQVQELRELFVKTGYSKILVYQNSLDDILGYVHSFDLFKKPKTIKSILKPVEFVPETMFVKDILNLLTKKRKSIAIILDEYGGTSGLITIEDIVEELFGEIEDEHDGDETLTEKIIEQNVYHFSTRLEVSYLNEQYKLNILESEYYSTLGGFIVNATSEIPEKGDIIETENFRFTILEASNTKIELVQLEVIG